MGALPAGEKKLSSPTPEHLHSSQLSAFVALLNRAYNAALPLGNQNALHRWSVANTKYFWHAFATFVSFPLSPAPTLDSVLMPANIKDLPALVNVTWFAASTTNFASPILRHAHTTPSATAIVFRPEAAVHDDAHRATVSFAELESRVVRLAIALRQVGVRKGDAVAAVLPNNPDTVIALLAVAAVGAVWSCCSPDFGTHAIVSRLAQVAPKVLFYTPAYFYKGRVHPIASTIQIVSKQLPSLQYLVSVSDVRAPGADAQAHCHCFSMEGFQRHFSKPISFQLEPITMRDPVVTMFSSGTTGAPKCVVQGTGILLNQMKEQTLHFDISSSSVVFFNTSTSWMLFNWLVAALATGATIVLYDGASFPPDDTFRLVRFCAEEGVTHFGCGAAYLPPLQAALHKASSQDQNLGMSATSLQAVLPTGSPSTNEHVQIVKAFFPAHTRFMNMYGGTEINGCFAVPTPWKSTQGAELQCAGLGMDVAVFDRDGQSVVERTGELVCRNACPCMPLYFRHDTGHAKYREAYFELFGDGVWSHGDFARQTAGGTFIISGRSDATLNPGGIRIGTADIYEAIHDVNFVNDSLVTEVKLKGGELKIVMFVILKGPAKLDESGRQTIRTSIQKRLSRRHIPYAIVQVDDVPYTFSGKKCEIPVRKMLNGRDVNNKEAVRNPDAFDSIRVAAEQSGLVGTSTVHGTSRARRSKL